MSIRQKLTLGMGAALLISAAILIALNIWQMRGVLDRYLIDSALPANVEAIARSVERDMQPAISASQMIADNTFLQNWIDDGEPRRELDTVSQFLDNVRQRLSADSAHFVSAETENYYTQTGTARVINRNSDSWFYDFLDSGEDMGLSLDVDEVTGDPTLFINVRMESRGRPLAVTGIGIGLAQMAERIREFRFGDTGIVYLVSAAGRVNIHPDLELTGGQLTALMGADAAQQLSQAGDYTLVEFQRGGEDYLAASQPLALGDWRIVVEVPSDEIYGSLTEATTLALIAGLVVTGLFLIIMAVVAARMTRPLSRVTKALTEIGKGGGDLTQRLEVDSEDELGELATGFNSFIGSQRDMIHGLRETAERLKEFVEQISEVIASNTTRAGEQSKLTDSVATAVYEMETTVQEISRNATDTASQVEDMGQNAGDIRIAMARSVEQVSGMADDIRESATAIQQLANEVGDIGRVIDVINAISDQTNLLALNAAIEAARAGEHGHGFSVVADEVRGLAQKTQTSTQEIRAIIERLQDGSARAVAAMTAGEQATSETVQTSERMGEALDQIVDSVDRIVGMSQQVAAATEEQSSVTAEISANVQNISELSGRSSDDMRACNSEVDDLRRLAFELSDQMKAFRL
ncbi:MAG: methyl-accepting chemotaxis protein [Pseudomonadota bacterium]